DPRPRRRPRLPAHRGRLPGALDGQGAGADPRHGPGGGRALRGGPRARGRPARARRLPGGVRAARAAPARPRRAGHDRGGGGRPDAGRCVHAGWLAALPAGAAAWWLAGRALAWSAADRELSEAVVALVAAAVLFSMSFWMISKVEVRRWTGYLRRGLEESLGR